GLSVGGHLDLPGARRPGKLAHQLQDAESRRLVKIWGMSEGGRPAAEFGLAVPRPLDAIEVGAPEPRRIVRGDASPRDDERGPPVLPLPAFPRSPADSRAVPGLVGHPLLPAGGGIVDGAVPEDAPRAHLELEVVDGVGRPRRQEDLYRLFLIDGIVPPLERPPGVAVLAVEPHVERRVVPGDANPGLLDRRSAAVDEKKRGKAGDRVP